MKVSVLVPWRDTGCEYRRAAFAYTSARWAALFPEFEVVVADSGHEPFNRGASRNRAAERATGDTFLVFDADTVVPERQVWEGVFGSVVQDRRTWFVLYGPIDYHNLTEHATDEVYAAGVTAELRRPVEGEWEHKLKSTAGALLLPRSAWNEVGGYDEQGFAAGWGWEDTAFCDAVDTLWCPHSRVDGFALALWHPRGDADFGGLGEAANRARYEHYRRARRQGPRAMRALVDGRTSS